MFIKKESLLQVVILFYVYIEKYYSRIKRLVRDNL